MFSRIHRDARGWLKSPSDARLLSLAARAEEASALVPDARRGDWDKLVRGFRGEEAAAKRKARVEGLVRACKLFAPRRREARAAERPSPPPLDAGDPADRLPGLGPQSRETLAKSGVTTVSDLVWTLPVAWDDFRTPLSVAEALERLKATHAASGPPPRMCVAGVVKSAGMVPMRGRRAVRVVLADEENAKATLHAWWFFTAHGVLALAKEGTRCILQGLSSTADDKEPPEGGSLSRRRDVRPRSSTRNRRWSSRSGS